MIKVIFDRQIVDGGAVFDVQTALDPIRFPLAGVVRAFVLTAALAFPITAARAFPLAGKQRKYP